MENLIKKVGVSYQHMKDSCSNITYEQKLNTIGAAGSATGGTFAYKSYKQKQRQHKIAERQHKMEVYKYAEELRCKVKQGEMARVRAAKILQELGLDPSYLDPIVVNQSESASKFASISNSWYSTKTTDQVSGVEVHAGTFFKSQTVKENPIKVGL